MILSHYFLLFQKEQIKKEVEAYILLRFSNEPLALQNTTTLWAYQSSTDRSWNPVQAKDVRQKRKLLHVTNIHQAVITTSYSYQGLL